MRTTLWARRAVAAVAVLLAWRGSAEPFKTRVQDVSPDLGIVLGNAGDAFVLDASGRVLVTPGRGGARRSDDRGEIWQRAMDGLVDPVVGVEALPGSFCVAPSNPRTVYTPALGDGILFNDRLYRSDDLGRRWRPLADAGTSFSADCAVDSRDADVVYHLAFSNETFLVVLLKSVDGGGTFAQVGAGLENLDFPIAVRVAPTEPGTLYVADLGTFSGVYASRDGGLTFAPLPAASTLPVWIAPHPTREGTLFVVGLDGVSRSEDRGQSFAPVPDLPPTTNAIVFDPVDPSMVYAPAGVDGLFRSTDGGATFARLPGPTADQLGHLGVISVGVAPGGGGHRAIYAGTSHGPFRSDDGGATFAPILRRYRGASVNDVAFDASGRLLVGVLNTVSLLRARADRGGGYDVLGEGIDSFPPSADAVAPAPGAPDVIAVVIGNDGVFRTDDGGATWSRAVIDSAFFVPTSRTWMRFAPSDPSRVYVATPVGGLLRSDDAARSFRDMATLWLQAFFATSLQAFAVDPRDADVLYVAPRDPRFGVLKSTDGGETFLPVGLPGSFGAMAVDPAGVVYVGSHGGGVFRSVDGGATWALASSGLAGGDVLALAIDPQNAAHVFAWVQAEGLFRSDDGAQTWRAVETTEALLRSGREVGRAAIAVDPLHPGRVYLGNSGVLQVDTGP